MIGFSPLSRLPVSNSREHRKPHMRRKVILLGPLPPPYGGVSIYMSSLFEHLKHQVFRMWALELSEEKRADPQISYIKHRQLGIIPVLLKEGFNARILDATHFHLENPNLILLPIWLMLKRLLRFEWYKNVHDGSLPQRHLGFSLLKRVLFRLAVNSVTEFVVVSEDLRRWLHDEIRVRQKISVVPSLLPIPHSAFNPARPADIEQRLAEYVRHHKRVCSLGVFIPNYGFKQVADAVERLREETGEDIGLILLDGTFVRDEDYRGETLRQRDWITVLENVPNPGVYEVFKRSDVFIRAVGQESYGISRVEALWCGIPVVATSVGETRGMLLYDFDDLGALRRQLQKALFDPPLQDVQALGAQFRKEAIDNLRELKKALDLN